jgi:hypothetical protein
MDINKDCPNLIHTDPALSMDLVIFSVTAGIPPMLGSLIIKTPVLFERVF